VVLLQASEEESFKLLMDIFRPVESVISAFCGDLLIWLLIRRSPKLPLSPGYIAHHHGLVKSVGDSRGLDPLGQGGFRHTPSLLSDHPVEASASFSL
jgi:hypothetical protein